MLLSELTAAARRLALVGLAKNTGKTVALTAILTELADAGRAVGVTSVGRDGEQNDVIDFRIEKPLIELVAGSLVATTDSLLRASGVPHELLAKTAIRTPLGEVLIARLKGGGTVEIAGPSAALDARHIADEMLALGAEQVLIDGAIDRRAASSPDVADGLVMSTGAILSEDIEQVVERTRDAVALVKLPSVDSDSRLRELARAGTSVLVDGDLANHHELPPRFALTAEEHQIKNQLDQHPQARHLIVAGALPEPFLDSLTRAARSQGRTLTVIAPDPTKVFLHERSVEHYRRAGIELRVLKPIELLALTVNPLAPQSHSFDSTRLRALLAGELDGLPIFDVRHPEYRGSQPAAPRG
ncbi:MAG TPA: hypothetical protein VGG08_03580 [Solirubrobacteraceae bacterium]